MQQPSATGSPAVEVRRSRRRTRTVTAFRERDTIVVLVPARMSAAEERRHVETMVQKVLAREARVAAPRGDDELQARAAELVSRYLDPEGDAGIQPSEVRWVGNQRQRWGSCTPASGVVRLSDRLRPLPAWVVDYVLVHELAHLREPSHSAAFWELVARYPRAERARGYLEGYLAGQGEPAGDAEAADVE